MNHGIWKTVNEGQYVPTNKINGVGVNKHGKNYTKDHKEHVQRRLKAKSVIITALGLD